MKKNALIVVDVQKDFLPGGSLAVPEGDLIIPSLNRLLRVPFNLKIATKDWHPREHCSFADNHPGKKVGEQLQIGACSQILWPVHCVQGSAGAEFSEKLHSKEIQKIFFKGTDPQVDSYSTFFDNARLKSTGLEQFLKQQGISTLFFAGLATEYCVKYSVLDALSLGFQVFIIVDACKGINPNDARSALIESENFGAVLISTNDCICNLEL